MKGEPRVIEYLNKSLRHELTVVNQFWVHARLLEDWGYSKLAAKELVEADEERQHAQGTDGPDHLPRGACRTCRRSTRCASASL